MRRNIDLCVLLSFLFCATINSHDSLHQRTAFDTVAWKSRRRFCYDVFFFRRTMARLENLAHPARTRASNSVEVFPSSVIIAPSTLKASQQPHTGYVYPANVMGVPAGTVFPEHCIVHLSKFSFKTMFANFVFVDPSIIDNVCRDRAIKVVSSANIPYVSLFFPLSSLPMTVP